ncbi:hypothetical protein, partial [Serratia nevei]|uniref:hypothetical protein n=1 Tax=Serratia nevei TaxID=2703794 RepID=UPI002AA0CEF6
LIVTKKDKGKIECIKNNLKCTVVLLHPLQVCPKREIDLSSKNSVLTFLLCVLTLFMCGMVVRPISLPPPLRVENFLFSPKRGPERA